MRTESETRGDVNRPAGPMSLDELEEELEHTRAEMTATLDALEQRLSPEELVNYAIHSLRGGPGEFALNLGRSVRDNPLPVTLMGIALAWMMVGQRTTERYAQRASDEMLAPESIPAGEGAGLGERLSERGEAAKARMQSAGEKVSGTTRATGERIGASMHEAASRMGESISTGRERISDTADYTREQARRAADAARYGTAQARDTFFHMINEQPLVLGALGLAIGALLGGAMPATRKENEMLGTRSDELKERAAATGSEQMEKATKVAESATGAALSEAERKAQREGMANPPGAAPTSGTPRKESVGAEGGGAAEPPRSPAAGAPASTVGGAGAVPRSVPPGGEKRAAPEAAGGKTPPTGSPRGEPPRGDGGRGHGHRK